MKKFSMGMMLSSLLVIQIGCGEEAPPVNTPAVDAGATMHSAPTGHDAATPSPDAATPGADPAAPGPDAATPGADASTPDADPAKEVAPE